MSQLSYNPVSQGPVIVPMDNYAGHTQRIMPPPEKWCNPRRTKVIIAIVILTTLTIAVSIAYISFTAKVIKDLEEVSYRSMRD